MTKKQFRSLKIGDKVWFYFDGRQYEAPPHVRSGTVVGLPLETFAGGCRPYWAAEFKNVPHPDATKSELTEKYVCANGFLTKDEAMMAAAGVAIWWAKELRKMANRFEAWAMKTTIKHDPRKAFKRGK